MGELDKKIERILCQHHHCSHSVKFKPLGTKCTDDMAEAIKRLVMEEITAELTAILNHRTNVRLAEGSVLPNILHTPYATVIPDTLIEERLELFSPATKSQSTKQ